MDRVIVYPGSLPQDTDVLYAAQSTIKALGALLQSTFGTSTFVDGLACTQTTVPSMSVTVGQGWIGSLSTVEATAYGSLSADTSDTLMKMGINITSTTLGPMSAPSTAGQSIVYLVEAQFQEVDTTAVVLPYYNASSPSTPYSGPAGAGTSQYTRRTEICALQLKAGTPATTGSQTTPGADTGWTALYAITIANGATSIVNSNIATVSTAPFIKSKLGPAYAALNGSSSNLFAVANGTTSNSAVNLGQFPSSLSVNGYKKVPDPNSPSGYLIYQWGYASIPTGNGDYVAFPIAFPNAVLSIVSTDGGAGCHATGHDNIVTTGFKAYGQINSTYTGTAYVYQAIGY